MGIIFAVMAALSQSILWVALKKSYENLAPSVAFFFDMILGLLVWVPFSLMVGVDFLRMGEVLVYALISGVLSEAFVFYVFSKGEVSYTSTIFSTYPLFTIFFSVLLNHERLSPVQWILVGVVIAGTLIVSIPEKISKSELAKKSFLIWPLLGALAVGISDTLSKGIIDETSAESFLFALAFAQIPISLGYLRYEKQAIPKLANIKKQWSIYKFALLGSSMNMLTVLFLWLAFARAPASIASPITASYPGFVVLLAVVFLKERVAKKDYFGFALIILSVMGISYLAP
jgi:drug/metabolite transporter (DMT)-like permease